MSREMLKEISMMSHELANMRQLFHRYPEVGFHEKETAARIRDYLTEWGLEVITGIGKTGVIGILRGAKSGKTLGIRADMDALPIQEETGLDFSSQNAGVMHACGHDSHITIALGVAKLMAKHRHEVNGTIKFIFQPAEEGLGGAQAMIEDGVLEDPAMDLIFALHNWPDLPHGVVGMKAGILTGNVDRFDITVHGKGGHGAMPQNAIDPIVIASQIVLALQTIVSRGLDPLDSAVVTVGKLQGGSAFNIIPEHVNISGTVRTFSSESQEFVANRVKEIASGICQSHGGRASVEYKLGLPGICNDPQVAETTSRLLTTAMGEAGIQQLDRPSMIGEDFSLFLQHIPGMMLFLGSQFSNNLGTHYPLHHPKYALDQQSIDWGVRVLSEIVIEHLF